MLGEVSGWAAFESTTAGGLIYLGASSAVGPWFVALEHQGVVEEVGIAPVSIPGPGLMRLAFDDLGELYEALHRIYQLSVSLPDAPLREFENLTRELLRTTEAERVLVQRIGQDVFRARLLNYWQGVCPLTGISDAALLRASHIVPWADCSTDAERLNVHNGLLLSALWDAAFDRALVSFNDEGAPLFSALLSDAARAELRWSRPIPLTDEHRRRLAHHRQRLIQ